MNTLMRKAARRASAGLGVLLLPLMVLGCSHRMVAQTATPTGDQAPVTLRNFEITSGRRPSRRAAAAIALADVGAAVELEASRAHHRAGVGAAG